MSQSPFKVDVMSYLFLTVTCFLFGWLVGFFHGNNNSSSSVEGRGKDSAYVTKHQYRPAALQLEDC